MYSTIDRYWWVWISCQVLPFRDKRPLGESFSPGGSHLILRSQWLGNHFLRGVTHSSDTGLGVYGVVCPSCSLMYTGFALPNTLKWLMHSGHHNPLKPMVHVQYNPGACLLFLAMGSHKLLLLWRCSPCLFLHEAAVDCTHKTPPWTSCAWMCCTRLLRCISVWSALLYLCLFQSVSSNEWPLNLWIAYRKLTKPTASQQCDHCLVCRVGVELQHQRSSWYTFFNQHNQVWVDKVSDEIGSYLLVIPMVQQCTMYVCHLATLATWPKCILVLCR